MTLDRFEDISTRFSPARLDLSAHIRLELAEFLLLDRSLSSACMVMHAHHTINMYICVCTHIGVDIYIYIYACQTCRDGSVQH